ncbi:MAG: error-prone DNA polymerase [Candidatus Obscuribacter sp.]|nr:error-prone DNA polymerase [Candidatus Obscuribacter sp.]
MSVCYAELHCHSAFSFLDGASLPEELVDRACELGLAALALTDTLDLGGIPRFAQAAREQKLDGIVGAELILEDDSQIVLLAMDLKGYKNISEMITRSRAIGERGSPRVSYADLFAHTEGLIALSGSEHGAIARALYGGDHSLAVKHLKKFRTVFGDRYYLEVNNHHIAQEMVVARALIEMSESTGVPWVVTNDVRYAGADKRLVYDVLVCLKHQCTLSQAGRRLKPNGSWYLKGPQEMAQLWQSNLTGIKNTIKIADQCRFRLGWLDPPLPAFVMAKEAAIAIGIGVGAGADNSTIDRNNVSDMVMIDSGEGLVASGYTYSELLSYLVDDGAIDRYGELNQRQRDQLDHELKMINGLKLAPYFLIMWDIVRFARVNGIAVQGRGSAANSAICYCLKITAVDPIAMDLLFERFLSEGRSEPPDIDLDIAHQEREKVLQYVYQKYGRLHAAMVCEVITYRGRSAVRDAARVLGFSQEQADMLASAVGHSEARDAAYKLVNGLLGPLGFDIDDRRVKLLIKVVQGLHQLPRHRSIHVGGFVLSALPIGQVVPVEPASMADRTVIQWDKDDLDVVGLIKIDLLGLGMLTMLQEGLKLVSQHRGRTIDIGKLDMTDTAIYQMLQKADTVGVFQVESRAQMNILPKLKPTCFYDIIVSIAIVRPGPIQGNIIHPYLRRRQGLETVSYLHPTLEPILKRTLGVPLFQEQGMKLAVTAAGFSASKADELRKVMSHKRSMEKMNKLCLELASGMSKNGFSEEAIDTITHQLRAFASYGFPESHAASFSLLVYASAYLKYYYPEEFFCAILNAQPMGFYSPATLIRDAIAHGVVVKPVDAAYSQWHCTLEPDGAVAEDVIKIRAGQPPRAGANLAIRIGFRYVDGLGPRAFDVIDAALSQGQFTDLADVVNRSGLGPADLKVLANAGAFETFVPGRRQALWQVLSLLKPRRALPLLDYLVSTEEQEDPLADPPVELPAMSELEIVMADFSTMQLSTGRHPVSFYRKWADKNNIYSCMGLRLGIDGDDVAVAGGVICRQRPETAKGFVFLTLEDETGMANVVINPKIYEIYRPVILSTQFLCIRGRLQLEQGVCNVIARHFEYLPPVNSVSDEKVHDEITLPSRNFH